ncbi:MAG: hypothetical protein Ct9H300mP3_03920 [Gammaproteobacteria bacterium]|nr:MAG: hypothetical protein Ct9H300mP3_03920 [Gammaproteobacteria bacterium]
MTNKSLELYLEKEGIEFLRTDVGDKYVLRVLKRKKLDFRRRTIGTYYLLRSHYYRRCSYCLSKDT